MGYRAVLFDLGGVVLDSPLAAIADYEKELGLPAGFVNRVVMDSGPEGAWARHERGELEGQAFLDAFADELAAAGHRIDTAELMARINRSIRPRPEMLAAVRRLRDAGYRVAAITNNWEPFGDAPITDEFDVFCESVVEGVRKPEPEIYRRCLHRLGVEAEEAVMLDDLGPNLKPARVMGMTTIKVASPDQALRDLSTLLDLDLSNPGL